jgi:general secretion pathway protein B
MSFILDALKKSDMQARQGELPTIHSSHAASNRQQHRPGWQYALLGGTAAGLVIAAIFLTLPDKTNDQLQTSTITQPEPIAPPAMPATDSNAPPPAMQKPASSTISEPASASASIAEDSVPIAEDTQTMASETQVESTPQPTSHPVTPKGDRSPPLPNRQEVKPATLALPDFKPQNKTPPPLKGKLPIELQQALPPIDISGHIFAEQPAARMVFINGHIQHEGDSISPGLRLVAITPSGVEMSFRDTPFRIDLFANRVRNKN